MKVNPKKTCAVVLAAGKGTRMKAGVINKVTLEVAGKPIIKRIIEKIKNAGIEEIYTVVGHAKESVKNVLQNSVHYVEQKNQLGTGHAVDIAVKKIPEKFENVFVFYGDDTAYEKETLAKLYERHVQSNAQATFLTIKVDDPKGLGRIVKKKDGSLVGIIEEKDADEKVKKIKEVNPGCFLFKRSFLKKYLPQIEKSPVTGEYYINDLITKGLQNGENIQAMYEENVKWRGINTPQELKDAENYI